METSKISVLRQFGSEQFSMSVVLPASPSEEDVVAGVDLLGKGISRAFENVLEREYTEKKKLAEASMAREASQNVLNDQIRKEMEAATEGKRLLKQAEKANRK